jgi:hypothetical protein
VADLGGSRCRVPTQRAGQNVGDLVQQFAGDQSSERQGRPADQDIGQVPDLLVLCHEFEFADAEFAG